MFVCMYVCMYVYIYIFYAQDLKFMYVCMYVCVTDHELSIVVWLIVWTYMMGDLTCRCGCITV